MGKGGLVTYVASDFFKLIFQIRGSIFDNVLSSEWLGKARCFAEQTTSRCSAPTAKVRDSFTSPLFMWRHASVFMIFNPQSLARCARAPAPTRPDHSLSPPPWLPPRLYAAPPSTFCPAPSQPSQFGLRSAQVAACLLHSLDQSHMALGKLRVQRDGLPGVGFRFGPTRQPLVTPVATGSESQLRRQTTERAHRAVREEGMVVRIQCDRVRVALDRLNVLLCVHCRQRKSVSDEGRGWQVPALTFLVALILQHASLPVDPWLAPVLHTF